MRHIWNAYYKGDIINKAPLSEEDIALMKKEGKVTVIRNYGKKPLVIDVKNIDFVERILM